MSDQKARIEWVAPRGWLVWELGDYADFCARHDLGPNLGDAMRAEVAGPEGRGGPDADEGRRAAIVQRFAASQARIGVRIAARDYRVFIDAGLLGSEAYLLSRAEIRDASGRWACADRVWGAAVPITALPRALPAVIASCGNDLGVSVLGNRPGFSPWFCFRAAGDWSVPSGREDGRLVAVEAATVAALFAGTVADALAGALPPPLREPIEEPPERAGVGS